MTVSYADIDLARLVRETAASFDGVAGARAIEYDVCTPEATPARVYPDNLQRILTTLLDNAFRFTPDRGRVRCELRASEHGGQPAIELRVSDTRPDTPALLREAVFEPSADDRQVTRPADDAGRGLAIVREFVNVHRGRVTIEQTPGGGATFVVRLPRSAPPGASPASLVRPESPAPRAIATVLIVEHDAEANQFVADALRERYRILCAHDAAEAIVAAASEKPDLIISNAMMAGMNGTGLLNWLRARPEFNSVPVVILTAPGDEASGVRLLHAGAQDHLTKPVLVEELRARVATHVSIKKARDILAESIASAEQALAALACAHVVREGDVERAQAAADRGNRAKV